MDDKKLIIPLASVIPTALFAISVAAASLAVSGYLDAREQLDIGQTDMVYLMRLHVDEQWHYRVYRDHRVYPDPAARWVLEERE